MSMNTKTTCCWEPENDCAKFIEEQRRFKDGNDQKLDDCCSFMVETLPPQVNKATNKTGHAQDVKYSNEEQWPHQTENQDFQTVQNRPTQSWPQQQEHQNAQPPQNMPTQAPMLHAIEDLTQQVQKPTQQIQQVQLQAITKKQPQVDPILAALRAQQIQNIGTCK